MKISKNFINDLKKFNISHLSFIKDEDLDINENNNKKSKNNLFKIKNKTNIIFDNNFLLKYCKIKEISYYNTKVLNFSVNFGSNNLNKVGKLLPNLIKLRLNNSRINNLTQLGINLNNLKILFISNCAVKSLRGIQNLKKIEEVYASFNEIFSIPKMVSKNRLKILDLDNNKINNKNELKLLETYKLLEQLNLSNNPITIELKDILVFLPKLWIFNDNNTDEPIKVSKKNINLIETNIKSDMEKSVKDFIKKTKSYSFSKLLNEDYYSSMYSVIDEINITNDYNVYSDNIINSKISFDHSLFANLENKKQIKKELEEIIEED